MIHYLIFFLFIFPLTIGISYGLIERQAKQWLTSRGWQQRDEGESNLGWEPELYNLPPHDEWLTLWQAVGKQRKNK